MFDDVYCNCLPGYTGQYCNLKIETQGCLSSPCKNGASCINLDNGTYACNCTPEYTDSNCATRKLKLKNVFNSNYLLKSLNLS